MDYRHSNDPKHAHPSSGHETVPDLGSYERRPFHPIMVVFSSWWADHRRRPAHHEETDRPTEKVATL